MQRMNLIVACLAIGLSIGVGGVGTAAKDVATPTDPGTAYLPMIDPANFTTTIDNPYFPLVPGTTLVYEGQTSDGPEMNRVTTTANTKVIMGVTCVEVHDVVEIDGEVAEDTLDWYAQDLDGNVWYFGEASSDLENGEVVSTAGSWEAGVDGALPGIAMLAQPAPGVSYQQEYYVGEAEDMGRVFMTHATVTIEMGRFDDVVVTQDWNPLEPGVYELKSYAAGTGLITARAYGSDEYIELTAIEIEGANASTPAY